MRLKMIGYLVHMININEQAELEYRFQPMPLTGDEMDAGYHATPVFRRLETTPDELPAPARTFAGQVIEGQTYPRGRDETESDYRLRLQAIQRAVANPGTQAPASGPGNPTPPVASKG